MDSGPINEVLRVDDENPYAPPKSMLLDDELGLSLPGEAYADRHLLAVCRNAVLPDRCLKCNAPADGYQFTRSLSWHRPFWFLLLLINLLLYIIALLFICWKATITVGVCKLHQRKRTRAIVVGWLTALAGIGSMFAAAVVPDKAVPIMVITGIVLLLAGVIGGMLGSRILVVERIDNDFVWLSHVSPEYLASFPRWPSG